MICPYCKGSKEIGVILCKHCITIYIDLRKILKGEK